jgi:hypothetical protein
MRGFVIAVLVVAGCQSKDDPGPPCATVVDHLNEVMKQSMPAHAGMELGNHAAMLHQCENRKMSPTERRCLLATKTTTDIAACTTAQAPKPAGNATP